MLEPSREEIENARKCLDDIVDEEEGLTYKDHVYATIRYLNKNSRGWGSGGVSLKPYEETWPEEKVDLFKIMLFDHGVRFDTHECMDYVREFDNN